MLRDISGYNIRISRQVKGMADPILDLIVDEGMPCPLLIISPPGMGKTTLLRDLARSYSYGWEGFKGVNVVIIDERSEIAGCHMGVPQLDVGPRTDVYDACPKLSGMMLAVRVMSPKILITDELGGADEAKAVVEAAKAGVCVVASCHAMDIDDLKTRPQISGLIKNRIFKRIIILGNSLGCGTIESVVDTTTGKNLISRPLKEGSVLDWTS